jgi:hypothetical protein
MALKQLTLVDCKGFFKNWGRKEDDPKQFREIKFTKQMLYFTIEVNMTVNAPEQVRSKSNHTINTEANAH